MSLVFMTIMLHVLTYVVSNKLFWNWNGVVRFVSQEVWFGKGFVIQNFRNYCLIQIVSLWSPSIGIQIIFNTNELVDRIRNLKYCIPEWLRRGFLMKRMRGRPDFLWKKMRRRQDLSNKMRRRSDFLTKSSWVLCPVNAVRKLFSTNLSSESSSFN